MEDFLVLWTIHVETNHVTDFLVAFQSNRSKQYEQGHGSLETRNLYQDLVSTREKPRRDHHVDLLGRNTFPIRHGANLRCPQPLVPWFLLVTKDRIVGWLFLTNTGLL